MLLQWLVKAASEPRVEHTNVLGEVATILAELSELRRPPTSATTPSASSGLGTRYGKLSPLSLPDAVVNSPEALAHSALQLHLDQLRSFSAPLSASATGSAASVAPISGRDREVQARCFLHGTFGSWLDYALQVCFCV